MKKRTPSEIAKFYECYVAIDKDGGTFIYDCNADSFWTNSFEWQSTELGYDGSFSTVLEYVVLYPKDFKWNSGYWNPKGEFIEVGE